MKVCRPQQRLSANPAATRPTRHCLRLWQLAPSSLREAPQQVLALDRVGRKIYSPPIRQLSLARTSGATEQVGSGRMEILEADTPTKIRIKLDFLKPFEAHNTAEFTMQPHGGATNILWVRTGPAPFMSKVMQVFMSFDSMIGKDFEAGLANLKTISESSK